jgi:hypothetical protein
MSGLFSKALMMSFVLLLLLLIIAHKYVVVQLKKVRYSKTNLFTFALLLAVFLFSAYFYKPHLESDGGVIYTSPAYWDFQWHAPLIQNFVHGDNIPPQNESFAGMPSTYHFFWGFLVSIYSSAGLGLVDSVNLISVLNLFFLLVGIIGIGEELFKSLKVGILAMLFTVTSSSLHILHYFSQPPYRDLLRTVTNIFTNAANPYFFSFIPGNPYGYNGNMFNMFYFLAERQMVMGIILLIFFLWLLYKREKIPNKALILAGALAGMSILWHLYISITIACSLLFLLIFDKDKRKTLYFLLPFSAIFLLHILYFKSLMQSVWFNPAIGNFPKINFSFPTMGKIYPLSLINAVGYYVYAYGLKILFFIFGSALLYKRNKKLTVLFLSVVIPTFILVNTIQLSPLSIYDNHKWLRPMNIFVDLIAAYALYEVFKHKGRTMLFVGSLFFILMTASGFLELIPFFNSQPSIPYAYEASPLVLQLRQKTSPDAVFLTLRTREIHMAGRKVFLGNYAGQDLQLNTKLRFGVLQGIYSSHTADDVCSLAHAYDIDFVETKYFKDQSAITHTKQLKVGKGKNTMTLVDIARSCDIK